MRLITSRIRHGGLPAHTIVGSSALLADAAAFIVEASSPEGLAKMCDLCEELLVLGPRSALCSMAANLECTQAELTKFLEQEPLHSVTAIKWRRSTHGGRTWAKPLALSSNIHAEINRARLQTRPSGAAAEEAAKAVLVSYTGRVARHQHEALQQAILRKIQEVTGETLTKGEPKKALKDGNWIEEVGNGGEGSGRLRMQLSSAVSVERMHAHLHGMPIYTGHSWTTVNVSNMFLPSFASVPKNGQRGAR